MRRSRIAYHRYFSVIFAVCLLPHSISGQTGAGQSSMRRSTLGVDPLGSRSTSPGINSQPADAPRTQKKARFQFVTGTVVMDDGGSPPSGVYIERKCGGHVKREADVDSRGNFSFQVGASNVLPDASEENDHAKGVLWNRASQPLSGPFGVASASYTDLLGCEISAQIVGYRSSKVTLGQYQTIGDINVGPIVLRSAQNVRGVTVSLTSMTAPKVAQKAFAEAEKAFRQKNVDQTIKQLETAVTIYPQYAAAWFELGQIRQQQHQPEEARWDYLKSIEADNLYVKPYVELARLAQLKQRWQDVIDITDRALELDPLDYCEAYLFNALGNYFTNRLDGAERSARKAMRLDGSHRYPQAHLVLANVLYMNQKLEDAAEQLRAYLKYAPTAANAEEVRAHLRDLEKEVRSSASTQMTPDHQGP